MNKSLSPAAERRRYPTGVSVCSLTSTFYTILSQKSAFLFENLPELRFCLWWDEKSSFDGLLINNFYHVTISLSFKRIDMVNHYPNKKCWKFAAQSFAEINRLKFILYTGVYHHRWSILVNGAMEQFNNGVSVWICSWNDSWSFIEAVRAVITLEELHSFPNSWYTIFLAWYA